MTLSAEAGRGDAVALDGVTRDFGIYRAVNEISLSIANNEFFTLLGPSGCGKTTLLRMIAGFDWPTSGRIFVAGDEMTHLPPNRRPINTVFQSYALFPHMTVAENIGFGLRMLKRPREEITATVNKMLDLIHLSGRGDQSVTRLSGGQQQRVALARALAPRPKVLLLDEPLSALDLKLRKAMQIELKRLQAETGITFIFVTHDQEEALSMSDRIAVLSEGSVRQLGAPSELYDHPADRFVADFIGETNFLTVDVSDISAGVGRVTLASGAVVAAKCPQGLAAGKATAVVRPEHAQLVANDADALLRGNVRDVIYLGTDTHFHVTLSDGSHFIVRQQNLTAGGCGVEPGQPVAIGFAEGTLQLLKD